MYEVDARGLSCPEPVMLTHEALKTMGESREGLVTEPHSRDTWKSLRRATGRRYRSPKWETGSSW